MSKISFNDVINELQSSTEYVFKDDLKIFDMDIPSIEIFMPFSILHGNEIMNRVERIFNSLYTIRKIEHFIEEF